MFLTFASSVSAANESLAKSVSLHLLKVFDTQCRSAAKQAHGRQECALGMGWS